MWREKFMSVMPSERLSYALKRSLDSFQKHWSLLASYFKEEWNNVICIGFSYGAEQGIIVSDNHVAFVTL